MPIESGPNYFSSKSPFRSLPRAERVEWFYRNRVIPFLTEDVTEAEAARLDGDHAKVKTIYDAWTGGRRGNLVYKKALARSAKADIATELEDLRVGIAGLSRIQHVDLNSQIEPGRDRIEYTRFYLTLLRLMGTYEEIGIDSLPSRTITGGFIFWLGEVIADQARSLEKLGHPDQAHRGLQEGLKRVVLLVIKLQHRIDLKQVGPLDPSQQQDRQTLLGAQLSEAVLTARLGRMSGDYEQLLQGLQIMNQVFKYEKNTGRLATLAGWNIQAAKDWSNQMPLRLRAKMLVTSATSLIKAYFTNRDETMSTLKKI